MPLSGDVNTIPDEVIPNDNNIADSGAGVHQDLLSSARPVSHSAKPVWIAGAHQYRLTRSRR